MRIGVGVALAAGVGTIATGCTSVPAAAQVTASLGADASSGTYGTGQRIATRSTTAGMRVRRGRVAVFAAVPIVRTDAPGNVVVTGGPLGLPILRDPARPVARMRRQGLGDAAIGASVQVAQPRRHRLAATLTATVKLPTASAAKGLGTGRTDVAVGADLARPGKVTPFATFSYARVGRPRDIELYDVASARGGLAVQVGGRSEVNLSYGYASRVAATVGDRHELGAGIDTAVGKRLSLGIQGSAGLSSGAPAAGGGVRLAVRL